MLHLKRFIFPRSIDIKAFSPILSSNKSYRYFIQHSFSSSKNPAQNNLQEDLSLLKDYSQKQKDDLRQIMKKYHTCPQDLNSNERESVLSSLHELFHAHKQTGNPDKAYRCLLEVKALSQRTDTIDIALNYYEMASILVDKGDWAKADDCTNEVSRICELLGDDPEVKSLTVQNYYHLAKIQEAQRNQDKALDLYHLVLEKIDDVMEPARPYLLTKVYQEMGLIYSSRSDIDQATNCWEKGLENAIKYFGEASDETYKFENQLATFLSENGQPPKALQHAQNSLKVGLQIFPKNSTEVGSNYVRLGKIHTLLQDPIKALDSYKQAIEIYESSSQKHSGILSDCYFQLVKNHATRDQIQEALDSLAKAEHFAILAYNGRGLAETYFSWAQELNTLEMFAESQEYFRKALGL